MKKNRSNIQVLLIMLTLLIMVLLIVGIEFGIFLNHQDTKERLMHEMLNKMN
jgi:uncharacterized protein YneF (UPF0154 family)